MTAVGISQSSALAPDTGKAKSAAASIFALLDQKSIIESKDDYGITVENLMGDIEFQHVKFVYRTRPDFHVFRDFCLVIPRAQSSTTSVLMLDMDGNTVNLGLWESADLCEDRQFLSDQPNATPIIPAQGEELKKLIGATVYIECSSKTQQNVKAVFDAGRFGAEAKKNFLHEGRVSLLLLTMDVVVVDSCFR